MLLEITLFGGLVRKREGSGFAMNVDGREREGAMLVSLDVRSPTQDTGIFSALVGWLFVGLGVFYDVGSFSAVGLEGEQWEIKDGSG